ncbi:hypothetical protein [Botrimarina sp.]
MTLNARLSHVEDADTSAAYEGAQRSIVERLLFWEQPATNET